MDWYLPVTEPAAGAAVRRELQDYLRRHGDDDVSAQEGALVAHELIANAVEHAAGPVWVRLSWNQEQPEVTVWDLGPGFGLSTSPGAARLGDLALDPEGVDPDGLDPDGLDPDGLDPDGLDLDGLDLDEESLEAALALASERGRGLAIVGELADRLETQARRGGGTEVSARLAVSRRPSPSLPSPTSSPRTNPLPALDEALPTGGFGKQSFLRALVVQLSQAVERGAGPEIAERAVTEVGSTIGQQMEAEYRLAAGIVGRLAPQQIADCLVRLKQEIDGHFRVLEVSDTRIVFASDSCPFGDVVKRSPALCRMTSSVFGGIAARNHDGGAAVILEERIAVGDPGCRVIVHLGPAPEDARAFAHHYPPADPATA